MIIAAITCLIRPTAAALWVFLGVQYLISMPSFSQRLGFLIQEVIPIGYITSLDCLTSRVISLGVLIAVDYLFYGKLIFVPLNFVMFNLVKDAGAFYGTHPWHWYLTQGFPATMGLHLPFFLLGVIWSKQLNLLYAIAWTIFNLSLLTHKEFRKAYALLELTTE